MRNCSRKFIQKSLESNDIKSPKETATLLEKYIYKTSNKLGKKSYTFINKSNKPKLLLLLDNGKLMEIGKG